MKLRILLTALLLSTPAMAQQPDPYARSDREYRLKQYYTHRSQTLDSVRFFFSAVGCGVITKDAADGFRNHYLTPLIEEIAHISGGGGPGGLPLNETANLWPFSVQAQNEGLAIAREPGKCEWFKQNPEVVRSLRGMAARGIY